MLSGVVLRRVWRGVRVDALDGLVDPIDGSTELPKPEKRENPCRPPKRAFHCSAAVPWHHAGLLDAGAAERFANGRVPRLCSRRAAPPATKAAHGITEHVPGALGFGPRRVRSGGECLDERGPKLFAFGKPCAVFAGIVAHVVVGLAGVAELGPNAAAARSAIRIEGPHVHRAPRAAS